MAKKAKLGEQEVSNGGELAGLDINFQPAGSTTKYPWDTWFNGTPVVISFGRDYGTTIGTQGKKVLTNHMFPQIKTAARHRYKIVSVLRASRAADHIKERLTELGYKDLKDTLILQGRDMMADERAAEDAKRAEEKVRKAELAAAGAEDVVSEDEADAA